MRGRLVTLLVIALLSASVGGASHLEDDAGSGGDAGNAPQTALPLPGKGTYQGNLTPAKQDADWYGLAADGTQGCAFARATATASAQLSLTSNVEELPLSARAIGPQGYRSLALVASAPAGWYLGVEPAPGDSGGDLEGPPAAYDFEFLQYGRNDLDPEDDGEGIDAGPTLQTAAWSPGPCIVGRLALDLGDDRDVFRFTIQDPQNLGLSFTTNPGAATLRLLDAHGTQRAQLSNDEATSITLGKGTWYVEVSAGGPSMESSGSASSAVGVPPENLVGGANFSKVSEESGNEDYIIGASLESDPPPDTQSCRPTCMTSLE